MLDESQKKWTLIHWEVGDEENFTIKTFAVVEDPRTTHYGRISMLPLYELIDQHIYGKLDELYAKRIAGKS